MTTKTAEHKRWTVMTLPEITDFMTATIELSKISDAAEILKEVSLITRFDKRRWIIEASEEASAAIKTLPFVTKMIPDNSQLGEFVAELTVQPNQLKNAVSRIETMLEEHLVRTEVARIKIGKTSIGFLATRKGAEFISRIGCVRIVQEKKAKFND